MEKAGKIPCKRIVFWYTVHNWTQTYKARRQYHFSVFQYQAGRRTICLGPPLMEQKPPVFEPRDAAHANWLFCCIASRFAKPSYIRPSSPVLFWSVDEVSQSTQRGVGYSTQMFLQAARCYVAAPKFQRLGETTGIHREPPKSSLGRISSHNMRPVPVLWCFYLSSSSCST